VWVTLNEQKWITFAERRGTSSTARSLAQSPEDIAKQFAGMWQLVSNPQRLVDGTMREGSNSVGYAFF